MSQSQEPAIDLSIIIPAYNEARALPVAIEVVAGYLDDRRLIGEVIVVDDGSCDDTRAIAEAAAEREDRVRLEGYERNRGKGHAVRHGVRAARGEAIVFLDADLATPVEEIDRALAAIADGADVVVGTRFHAEAEIERPQPWLRRFMGGGFRWLAKATLGLSASDITCGFKGFTAEAARAIFSRSTIDGWAFDAELLVIARRLGLRVVEVPVRWSDSRDSRVRPLANAIESWRQLMQIRRRLREGAYDPGRETMAE
ncbi:MAG: dolichyl-phosphate beta-glucosyltransferase [Armatimonadota bacterium]